MKAYVGGGWYIHHLSDRVLELRKDDHTYRKFTGADGFVRTRGQPGIERATLFERSLRMADACDKAMAFRVASELIPTAQSVGDYRERIEKLTPMFNTGEEPESIGQKRA